MECPDCSDLFVFVSVNENACNQHARAARVRYRARARDAACRRGTPAVQTTDAARGEHLIEGRCVCVKFAAAPREEGDQCHYRLVDCFLEHRRQLLASNFSLRSAVTRRPRAAMD
eukprot:COSAG02_NODE_7270_length_3089_cov_2.598662_1_plen_115_part_00